MKAMILLSETEAASFLGIRPSTLAAWRYRGTGPVFRKIGRLCRYLQADLETYVETQARKSTAENFIGDNPNR